MIQTDKTQTRRQNCDGKSGHLFVSFERARNLCSNASLQIKWKSTLRKPPASQLEPICVRNREEGRREIGWQPSSICCFFLLSPARRYLFFFVVVVAVVGPVRFEFIRLEKKEPFSCLPVSYLHEILTAFVPFRLQSEKHLLHQVLGAKQGDELEPGGGGGGGQERLAKDARQLKPLVRLSGRHLDNSGQLLFRQPKRNFQSSIPFLMTTRPARVLSVPNSRQLLERSQIDDNNRKIGSLFNKCARIAEARQGQEGGPVCA